MKGLCKRGYDYKLVYYLHEINQKTDDGIVVDDQIEFMILYLDWRIIDL